MPPSYANPDTEYLFKGVFNKLAHIRVTDTDKATTVPLRPGKTVEWQLSAHTFPGTRLHDAVLEGTKALCNEYNKTVKDGKKLDPASVICADGTATFRLAFKLRETKGLGNGSISKPGKNIDPKDLRKLTFAIKPLFIELGLNPWVDSKGVMQPGLRACMCLFDYDRSVTVFHSIEADVAEVTGFDVVDESSDEDDGLVDTAAAGGAKGKGKKRKIGGR